MLQGIFGEIAYFFYSLNQNAMNMMPEERFSIFVSVSTLIITIIAIITALVLYNKQKRNSCVRKMITIISSFDLLYYSLEKHFKSWKEAKGEAASQESQDFWKMINLTETVTSMQELKTLSSVYSRRLINVEINSLLDFLGDLILISFGGVDQSGKDYLRENIISSDDFGIQMLSLIKKLSRGIGIKVHKNPEKELLKNYVAGHYLK